MSQQIRPRQRDQFGRFLTWNGTHSGPAVRKVSKRKVVVKPVLQPVTHFRFVIDRSGSMQSIWSDTITALNDNIETIRIGAKGQTALVSISHFDDSVETYLRDTDVHNLKSINGDSFRPRNSTALFDAVGQAIEELEKLPNDSNVAFLVQVLTDGAENASTQYTADRLLKLIRQKQDSDKWTFVFLVPHGGRGQIQAAFKNEIPDGNIREWTKTTQGVQEYAKAASLGSTQYMVQRSVGITSTQDFFLNANQVTNRQVQRRADDYSARVKIWHVDKETDIQPFIETRSGDTYRQGMAYYQITKKELIQPHKQLMIREKGTKTVYGGQDVRTILGVPTTGNVRVEPRNLGNWDIFVQSTSVNRKLVRGTDVVYFLG